MSLVNQLITAIFAVLIGLVSGTLYIMSDSSRGILENQLESHAQDSATHLGLYLAPYIAAEDKATIETAVNAIFDTGFYQNITVTNAEDIVLFAKNTPPVVSDDVPDWFQKIITITPPAMSREVTFQWRQAGKIHVQSRAGYAYEKLWKGAQDSILLFVSLSIVCLLAISYLIRFLLKPLKKVEDQAVALSQKRFVEQAKLPRTRELKYVVEAMNNMVHRVKYMFDEQSRNIEELRKSAYQDNLTGLFNQRATESQLAEKLDHRDSFSRGTLLVFQLLNLQKINNQLGVDNTNTLIKFMAAQLQRLSDKSKQSVLGRLTGAEFVLLTEQTDSDLLSPLVENLNTEITQQFSQLANSEPASALISVGSCALDGSTGSKQLLSHAHLAADEAAKDNLLWKRYDSVSQSASLPEDSGWKEYVATAIGQRAIFLQVQQVISTGSEAEILQEEILARILNRNGQPATAGEFINVVKELGLIPEMDKAVIELAVEYAKNHDRPLTINISHESISTPSFHQWLFSLLHNAKLANKLMFEVDETGVLNHMAEVTSFRKALRGKGIAFGVDHFGVHPSGFAYLYAVQPDYVKIDGSLIRSLEENAEDKFFVSSLISVAHSLDIHAYAEHVENAAQRKLLTHLKIEGTQGYLHGAPKSLID